MTQTNEMNKHVIPCPLFVSSRLHFQAEFYYNENSLFWNADKLIVSNYKKPEL